MIRLTRFLLLLLTALAIGQEHDDGRERLIRQRHTLDPRWDGQDDARSLRGEKAQFSFWPDDAARQRRKEDSNVSPILTASEKIFLYHFKELGISRKKGKGVSRGGKSSSKSSKESAAKRKGGSMSKSNDKSKGTKTYTSSPTIATKDPSAPVDTPGGGPSAPVDTPGGSPTVSPSSVPNSSANVTDATNVTDAMPAAELPNPSSGEMSCYSSMVFGAAAYAAVLVLW